MPPVRAMDPSRCKPLWACSSSGAGHAGLVVCLRPLPDLWQAIAGKLRGHFNYFGVTDNNRALRQFDHAVHRLVFKWLNRRSQRHSFSWVQFCRYRARYPLPAPSRLVSLLPVWGKTG